MQPARTAKAKSRVNSPAGNTSAVITADSHFGARGPSVPHSKGSIFECRHDAVKGDSISAGGRLKGGQPKSQVGAVAEAQSGAESSFFASANCIVTLSLLQLFWLMLVDKEEQEYFIMATQELFFAAACPAGGAEYNPKLPVHGGYGSARGTGSDHLQVVVNVFVIWPKIPARP